MALLHYAPPQSPYLNILYRDDDILVLNKPSGLLSVPGKAPDHKDSLQRRVQRVFPTATTVHRLDMATSGIIIMAMNINSHRHLSRQFEMRKTRKRYLARVAGCMLETQGAVELPLICDWPNRPRQMVSMTRGKAAVTRYTVLSRDAQESLVELVPVTGRSHQLRVHMLSLGHPILGDRLYAHQQALEAAPRLQLHAQQLCIEHPNEARQLTFDCPAPFSFKSCGVEPDNANVET